jgi:hypothetical protein
MVTALGPAVFAAPGSFLGALPVPLSKRLIKVNFYVDNRTLLDQRFLEVSVMGDRAAKKIVAIDSSSSGPVGSGVSDLAVPDGPVNLTICGLVKCNGQDSELVCGKTQIPADIPLVKDHEVTFSTAWACSR